MLDDPDLYIDKVDYECKVDPELVAELDSVGLPFEDDKSAPATGWPNAGADNKCTQNGSGNWDVFIEKPAEVNKWKSEVNLAPDTVWGGQAKVITPEAVWGGQSSNKWGNNSNTSWGASLEKPSWRDCSKNHYSSNNWNNFHSGPSNDRYRQPEDPSYTSGSGRKRNGSGGGYFKQRNNKQSYQDEGQHQQHRTGGWQQDQRGRNRQWRPVYNRAP